MKYRTARKTLCLLLCAALLMPQLCGCSRLFGKKTVETLNAETTRVGDEKLSLDLGDCALKSEAKCEIKEVSAPPMEGVDIKAYDFTIDTDEQLAGVMELTIPYDEKSLEGRDPEGNIGVAYYNEETKEWEPVVFRINDNGTITISTIHLSTYGCFSVVNENTRNAYSDYVSNSDVIYDFEGKYNIDANAIINSAINNGGKPGEDAVDAGLSVLGTSLSIGSGAVDTIAHGLNAMSGVMGTPTGTSLFNNISEKMGDLGFAVSCAQVAYGMSDIYINGNKDAVMPCVKNAMMTSASYTGGKVGGQLFNLAFLGVIAIDYSLNKFAEAAWQGREDEFKKAYAIYYGQEGVKRSANDWAWVSMDARKTAYNAEKYGLRVEGLVRRYADQFWKLDETTQGYYHSEATGRGSQALGGLNDAMKERISADYVNTLFNTVVPEAFKIIAERDAFIASQEVYSLLNSIRWELNKTCTIDLYDGTLNEEKKRSDMAGARVNVVLPSSVTDAEDWSATLNDKGEGKIEFTLLAYLMAELPSELELVKTGDDSPEPVTIPFTMQSSTQRVDVGVDALPLEEILGEYDGELKLTSIVISDTGYQAYLSESEGEDTPSKAEFDATLNEAAQGKLHVDSLSITSDAPESGQCTIKTIVSNNEGETQPATVDARYEDGFLIIQSENGEGRVAVRKGADGVIELTATDAPMGIHDPDLGDNAIYIVVTLQMRKIS